jgi:hypothetical protein
MYPSFEVVVGLAWSYDPQEYASGRVATGRVFHPGQIKYGTDKWDTLVLKVGIWALG